MHKKEIVGITRGDIIVCVNALGEILNKLPPKNEKLAYWLTRNLRILQPEITFRETLIKKYGVVDAKTNFVSLPALIEKENGEKEVNPAYLDFQKDYSVEASIETTVEIYPINIDEADGIAEVEGRLIRDSWFIWESEETNE